jgi:hypothetical protein
VAIRLHINREDPFGSYFSVLFLGPLLQGTKLVRLLWALADAANHPVYNHSNFWRWKGTSVIEDSKMTIPEIAVQLREALGNCVDSAKDVSPAERSYFTAAQNDSSDEEVISFWLSVSYLGGTSCSDVCRQAVG